MRQAGMKGEALKAKGNKPGSVRIIAGEWRGRRLPVPDLPGLRPSGDRSRETLFNWLQGHLAGTRCLDLFAGTGVLGLEAVSRGAASAVLVEKDRTAATQLHANVSLLQARNVEIVNSDALVWLQHQPTGSFNLVFIDPPFGQGLAVAALELLQVHEILQASGLVYVETARSEISATLPSGWEVLREKSLGEVRMLLLRRISHQHQA
jgi:16S rRNA (guanine966-N2)-methyltransferase